jgi:hypothetical protein
MAERKILPMNEQLIGCELRQFRDKKPSKVVIVPVDRRRRTHQGEREANYRNWKLSEYSPDMQCVACGRETWMSRTL